MSKEFTRVLRKTLRTTRKTLRDVRTSKTSESIKSEEPPAGPNEHRFRTTVHGVKFAKRLSTAARNSITDPYVGDRRGSSTSQLPPVKFAKRRAALDCATDEVDLQKHMELIASSASEKSEQWIINPFSKFRFRWDMITVCVILLNVVTLPLEFSIFDDRPELNNIKMLTDLWFMLDIMLNFRTGFIEGHGKNSVNMDPAAIRKEYLRFELSIFGSLPIIHKWTFIQYFLHTNFYSLLNICIR